MRLLYYDHIEQRVRDVIRAQYSPNLSAVQDVICKYDIDIWLLERDAFDIEHFDDNKWLHQFQPETERALEHLRANNTQIGIKKAVTPCTIFADREAIALDAKCVLQVSQDSPAPVEQTDR